MKLRGFKEQGQAREAGKPLRRALAFLLVVLLVVPQTTGYAADAFSQSQTQEQEALSAEAAADGVEQGEGTAVEQGEGDSEEAAAEASSSEGDEPAPSAPAESSAPSDVTLAESAQDARDAGSGEGDFATLADAALADAADELPDDPAAYVEGEVIVVLAGEAPEAAEAAAVEESVAEISGQGTEAVAVEIISEGSAPPAGADVPAAPAPAPSTAPASDGSTVLVDLPADVPVEDALLQLANDESVAFVQPNYVYTLVDGPSDAGAALIPSAPGDPAPPPAATPAAGSASVAPLATAINDPYAQPTGSQDYGWWLQSVNVFDAWDLQKVEGSVTIAIIDTGVHLAHDDLKDNILTSLAWDAVSGQPLASVGGTGDVDGHGTHVAGIAAARANNNKLFAGISYNANILPIKVFSADAQGNLKGETADVVKAYDYIMERNKDSAANVRIVNLSIGGPAKNTALHNKIIAARSAGILTVAAAGNSNKDSALYPADYPEVISVVAVDRKNQRASFSNYGTNKDIAAPGTEVTDRSGIWSTYSDVANPSDNDATAPQQGTSMAAPIVSGTAALLFAENPALTPAQVQQTLYSTATDLGTFGKDVYYGYGLVNAKAALDSLQPAYTPYTVTLDPNGGSVRPLTVSKDRDAPLGALPAPTRTGFHFEGWYTAPSGGSEVTDAMKLTGDATYYARWTIERYTVRFDANGGTVSLASFKRTYQAALGKLPTPRKTGFIFEGWYTGKVKGTRVGATTKATKDITCYAHWITDFNRVVVTIASAKNNGRVFDIKGASTARAALLQINPQNTMPAQRFRLERVKGTTATYVIRNINSNKVLGISGGKATNRAVIRQYSANNTRAQRWKLVPAAGNSYSIVSVLNENMALGLTAGSVAKGTTIRLFKSTGSANQRFVLNKVEAPLANGTYTITSSVRPGKALSLAGGSTKNGTALQLAAPNKGAAQKFRLTYDRATGYYTIVNVRSGKALDVAGAGKKNGTKVQVYTSNRTAAQKWTIVKTKSGYTLYSACSGLVLDVAGKASTNGAKAQTRTAKGTAAQAWVIRKA
jgi:uncharacterized repeat protein (TIGR02543 family)